MATRFEISGCLKHAEEDVFADGCIPPGSVTAIDVTFQGSTAEECVKAFRDFVGPVDDGDVELDACEEDGRVDVQIMETDDGIAADDDDVEEWKAGRLRLWLCTYTAIVERVTRERIAIGAAGRK